VRCYGLGNCFFVRHLKARAHARGVRLQEGACRAAALLQTEIQKKKKKSKFYGHDDIKSFT
jgi:hypothetical protein